MTIWIMILLLLGLFALSSYFQGAIRAGVCFLGLLLGLVLAFPLAPTVRPLIPMMGLAHPVWGLTLAPLLALILIEIVFFIGSFFAHYGAVFYFRLKTNDAQGRAWERLNRRLGACLGLARGTVYCLVIGLLIYVAGYPTVQTATDEKDATLLKLLNRARLDMQSAGLDKLVARFDPMPAKYYQVADLLGLLYQNPLLRARIASYPPIYAMAERQEYKDVANDKDFFKMWAEHPSVADLANQPMFLGMINNSSLVDELLKMDLKDFQQYLEKGQSPVYDPMHILGRWELDVDQVVLQAKKNNPDITAGQLQMLKRVLAVAATNCTITATCDKRAVFRGARLDFNQLATLAASTARPAARAAVPAQVPAAGPANRRGPVTTSARSIVDAGMARRYGLTPGPQPAPAAPPGAAPAAQPDPESAAPKLQVMTVQGTWEGENNLYSIKLNGLTNANAEENAEVDGDQLILTLSGQRLIFVRQG
jgi:hypothetical protein